MRAAIGAAAVASIAVVACSGGGGGGPSAPTVLVLGVQADDQIVSLAQSIHVRALVAGQTVDDETLDLRASPGALPKEVRIVPAVAAPAAGVEVHVDAYGGSGGASGLLVSRSAHASFVPGKTKLLRIALENRCIVSPPLFVGCNAPQTCISGRCQDDTLDPDQLEDYTPSWAADVPDVCKPAGHGDPAVIVGTGQTDFLPVTDGQTLQAERGPQGGHHVWVAVRVKNLKQSGSTTTIQGTQPSTGVTIPPTAFVFTFDPDEGGYCKLFGLRYQLDNGGIDYKQFLGKPLDLSVTVRDASGAQAQATAHVTIAPTVIGE